MLKRSDIAAFARRDWRTLEKLKAMYWADAKRTSGAALAIRVAEELRQQTRSLHPNWPTQQERQQDLATHARVAASLRRGVSHQAR